MSTIESGLASGLSHDIAAMFGQVYRVNDWNPMTVWDGFGDSAVAAGIAEPVAYSTNVTSVQLGAGDADSGITPGAHVFRYRYANSKTQYVSNPSDFVQFSAAEGALAAASQAAYIFSNIIKSPDPKVDRIVAELTKAGGNEFYRASVIANSNAALTLSIRDDDLAGVGNILDWPDFDHDVPPFFQFVEPHQQRLWGLGHIVYDQGQAQIPASGLSVVGNGTEWTSAAVGRMLLMSGDERRFIESVVSNTLLLLEDSAPALAADQSYKILSEAPDVMRVSLALRPESWPPRNVARVLDGRPEAAVGLKGYRRDMVIFGARSMQRNVYSVDPLVDGALEDVEGERGAASRLCVQEAAGYLWALDYKGIHRYAGGTATDARERHVSEPIDPYFDRADTSKGYVDMAYATDFHSVHFPQRHQIIWFVVMNGMPGDATVYTKPQHAIVMDYMNGSLALWKFDVPMVASFVVPGSNGVYQTVIADENGRLWVVGIGTTDGIHSDNPVSIGVKAGATVTSIPTSGATALYTGGDGLAGAVAYWEGGDERDVIASNSASGFTLVNGFTVAPSAEQTIHFGRIPSRWKSKAFVLDSPDQIITQARYLNLFFEPKSVGTIRVRFYLNRSATAFAGWARDYSDAGVTLDMTNNYYEVDITRSHGAARISLPTTTDDSTYRPIRTIEFEIEIVSATPFEMNGFSIDGYSEEEDLQP